MGYRKFTGKQALTQEKYRIITDLSVAENLTKSAVKQVNSAGKAMKKGFSEDTSKKAFPYVETAWNCAIDLDYINHNSESTYLRICESVRKYEKLNTVLTDEIRYLKSQADSERRKVENSSKIAIDRALSVTKYTMMKAFEEANKAINNTIESGSTSIQTSQEIVNHALEAANIADKVSNLLVESQKSIIRIAVKNQDKIEWSPESFEVMAEDILNAAEELQVKHERKINAAVQEILNMKYKAKKEAERIKIQTQKAQKQAWEKRIYAEESAKFVIASIVTFDKERYETYSGFD